MGNIMCASVAKVFEEIYVLRVDRYWNLCFHGSFRTPFRPGWYKVLRKNLFRYQREIFGLRLYHHIIISFHQAYQCDAMIWSRQNSSVVFIPPQVPLRFDKIIFSQSTQPPHYASTAADNLLAAARVECPGSTDRSSVTQNPSPTAAKFTAKPHILLDTLKKWVSNNFTRSL